MSKITPLPEDKKLNVIFRVEAGCLGPNGEEHINNFCAFAQKEMETIDSEFISWEILPRNDKSLPEMEYIINNKKLSYDKTKRLLDIFNKNMDEFEGSFHEKISNLIEVYLGN